MYFMCIDYFDYLVNAESFIEAFYFTLSIQTTTAYIHFR